MRSVRRKSGPGVLRFSIVDFNMVKIAKTNDAKKPSKKGAYIISDSTYVSAFCRAKQPSQGGVQKHDTQNMEGRRSKDSTTSMGSKDASYSTIQ